jgi:hypothetical protein
MRLLCIDYVHLNLSKGGASLGIGGVNRRRPFAGSAGLLPVRRPLCAAGFEESGFGWGAGFGAGCKTSIGTRFGAVV